MAASRQIMRDAESQQPRAAISDSVSRSSNPLSATFFAVLPTSRHAQRRVDLIAGGANR
jgi:hypothetical protein